MLGFVFPKYFSYTTKYYSHVKVYLSALLTNAVVYIITLVLFQNVIVFLLRHILNTNRLR
jgi:hypothetical protein